MPGKDLFAAPSETKAEKAKGKDLFASSRSASPFLQKGMGMLPEGTQPVFPAGAMASEPQMRASLPAATAPDRMQNRTDSAVLAMRRKVEADISDATRKARVKPVERAAGREGIAQLDQGPITANPNAAYSEFMLPPDAQRGMQAEREVYRANDVTSSVDAATIRGVNSMALGIPGLVNDGFREELGAAGRDQPGAALAGDIAGFLIPGELAWKGAGAAYNATLKPLVNALLPKGGSGLARATRMTGRLAEGSTAFAGQNALYQGTIGESTAAAEEGRAPSLESALGKAEQGAKDPINVLGPAGLMALNRLGKFVTSGGRTMTPDSIATEVAGRTAGRSGDGSVLNAEAVGGSVDRRAEGILVRMLGEVGYRPNDIRAALASFDQLANQATDLPTLAARLKDVLIDKLGPKAEDVLQKFLQGAGVSGGTASETVRRAVGQDYGRLGQFLEDSANARLGAGSRYDTLTGAQQEMKRIGDEGYERVFSAPPADPASIDDLKQALDFYSGSELGSPLRQIAAGKMLNVEQMIANDPRRAAHWIQMAAGRKAQEAFDAGNTVLGNAYTDMRNQILSRLEKDGVAPGYQQARMQFGDEFGAEQAITFGSRFFTKVTDTVGVRQIADDLRNLTTEQQEAALLSIRDELLRLAGRHRKGAPPVTTQIGNEQSLAGLETVIGEKGGQLANDIRFIDERLARLRRIDPITGKSSTIPSREALEEANRVVSNPMMRRIGNVMEALGGDAAVSSVAASVGTGGGAVLPIFSLRAGMRSMGNALARGRQGKIDDVTSLLLRDAGASPRGPMPGDDLPALTSRGGPAVPPAVGGGQQSAQPPNALSGATMSGQRGGKPPPAPRGQDTIASEIADIERTLKRKGYTLNEAETLAEDGRLPEELRGLMIVHADLVRESGRMQGAGARAKGGAGNDPEYLRAESDMNKASDDVANAEAEIARDLREQGLNWEGETGDFMGVIDTLQREGRLSNYLTSRVADLRAASTRMLDAEAKMKARVQSLSGQPSPIRAGGFAGAPSSQPNAQWARESDGTMRAAFPDNPDVNLIVNPEGEVLFSVGGKIKGRKEGGTAQDFVNAVNAVIPALRQHASGPDALPFYSFSGASESQANIYRRLLGRGISDDMAAYETLPGEFVISRLSPEDLQRALPETPLRRITEQDASPLTLSKKDRVNPLPRNGLTIGPNAQNALAGAGLGGIAPADSAEERARNMAIGAGLGGVAGRLPVRSMADDVARTAGAPKTAAQAAKFETPGSPEWEAAKAKGLDMSTAARKQRALAAGYNTDQVWYHGTRKDFDAFDTSKSTDGLGIHVGTVDQAEGFAKSTKSLSMQNQAEFKSNRQILPLYVRANNSIRLPDMQDWEPNRVVRALRRKGIDVEGSGYQGAVMPKDIVSALKREGYDSIVYKNMFEADASGKDSLIIFDPSNIRSVNAAFDPDKAASPILTAGAGGGRKPPNPDSPEAIKAALKDMTAKPKAEPTRLARMVEEGRNADVPPIRGLPDQDVALTEQAMRMEERGLSPIEIYDQTGVAMVPYNGAQVPIISPKMGPEELTRQFYTALAEPASKRPDWVKEILARAPRKKGLMLRDKAPAPTQPNALAEPPLPSPGTPYGAIGIGAGIGAATGIPAGAVIGTMMAREQDRKRNALAQ